MKLSEILAQDTKGKSLNDLIEMLGSTEDAEAVYQLRKRHEEDSGIPMEKDDFGQGEEEIVGVVLPELSARIAEIEDGPDGE